MHKNKGSDRGRSSTRQMGRKDQKLDANDRELETNDLRMDMREIAKRIELLGMYNFSLSFHFHEILLFFMIDIFPKAVNSFPFFSSWLVLVHSIVLNLNAQHVS